METLNASTQPSLQSPANRSANDNLSGALARGRSVFPLDAVARIFRPSSSPMTSARRREDWMLIFERRTPPYVEPLMGYCGGNDTLAQVQLSFPTLDAAIRYAQSQGLSFVVQGVRRATSTGNCNKARDGRKEFSDSVLEQLGLAALQDSYGLALATVANDNPAPANPSGTVVTPMDVMNDPDLSLSEKRAMLMNSAWNECLIDQATAEGMPENRRPSRLHEVELALLGLEHEVAPHRARPTGAFARGLS